MQKILNMSEWQTRVRELFHMAYLTKENQGSIQTRLHSMVYSELSRKHGKKNVYTSYMRGYVQGLIDAERRDIQQNQVEFCYLVDGVLFSTHKTTDKRKTEEFYLTGRGHELGNYPSGFVWKNSEKVYFGFDSVNSSDKV